MSSPIERLRRAFSEACGDQDIRGSLTGALGALDVSFAGQEGADAALMRHGFTEELRRAGVEWDELAGDGAPDEAALERYQIALRATLARMRVLLVELNSYISGGLAWVFPPAPEALSGRGLANYRFPARAAVDVTAQDDHVRIHVHEADLGEVTSSGFYVPAIVRGDFCATIRYRICAWQPGDAAVCMGLFAQDQPSGLRYYAMRRSSGERPHEVLANFSNQVFSDPQPAGNEEGWLRLERRGDLVTCSHRQGGDWVILGEHRGDPPDDVLFGAKIWSSGRAGPFEAQLFDLQIEGELPSEQLPAVPVKPDPRDA